MNKDNTERLMQTTLLICFLLKHVREKPMTKKYLLSSLNRPLQTDYYHGDRTLLWNDIEKLVTLDLLKKNIPKKGSGLKGKITVDDISYKNKRSHKNPQKIYRDISNNVLRSFRVKNFHR